jgi:SAM-dependent methyltransferase
LPENRQVRILDMGCGNGAFVAYLRHKGYEHVEGIDISTEQIEAGSSVGISNLFKAEILPWIMGKKDQYDLIIALDVLEHFSRQEIYEILKYSKRALKKGGGMMIQTPNGEGIWYEKIFYGDITHETLLSRDSARQFILGTGFGSIQTYPIDFPVINLRSFLRKCAWNWMVAHHKFRKWIATGEGSGVFTPNLLILARK